MSPATETTDTFSKRPDGIPDDWVQSCDLSWHPAPEDLSKIPSTFLKLDSDGENAYREFGRHVGQLRIDPRKFSMITDDLRAVLAFVSVLDDESRIRQLEAEKAQIRSAGITSESCELRELLLSAADTQAEQPTPEQRLAELKSAVDDLIKNDKVFRRVPPYFDIPPQQAFVERVREIFRPHSVEAELLKAAVAEILPPESESCESIEDEIARIDKEIVHLQGNISRVWYPGFASKFYRRGKMPINFWIKRDDCVFTTNGSHVQNIALTRTICEEFLKTWKSRAKCFNEPVSVNAISIATMPEPMAQNWAYAFRYAKIREELFDESAEIKRTKFTPIHFSHQPKGW